MTKSHCPHYSRRSLWAAHFPLGLSLPAYSPGPVTMLLTSASKLRSIPAAQSSSLALKCPEYLTTIAEKGTSIPPYWSPASFPVPLASCSPRPSSVVWPSWSTGIRKRQTSFFYAASRSHRFHLWSSLSALSTSSLCSRPHWAAPLAAPLLPNTLSASELYFPVHQVQHRSSVF